MSNIKEREKFDEFEMKDEPKKIPVSLRLDNDIVLFFKKLASEKKVPYQTLINALLRKELQAV